MPSLHHAARRFQPAAPASPGPHGPLPPAPSRIATFHRRTAGAPAAATAAALALLAFAAAARADVQITLDNAFVDQVKDRATLGATYTVDRTQVGPAAPSGGGTLRAAGRAPEVGLPIVARVLTAAPQRAVTDLFQQAERSGTPLAVRGVWRLWCGQGGDAREVQGQPLAPLDSADPPHVFELHPLLRAGDADLGIRTFRPADGWIFRDASQAFLRYEQLASHITAGDGTTTITTRMAGTEPYVEFVVRLNEAPDRLLVDGLAVKAALLDTAGEILVAERRIVAVAGTPPYERLKALHKGNALHVVGVPRIDLSQVAWRIAHAADTPGVLDWSLPYEMVLVAVFDDSPSGPDITPIAPPEGAAPKAAAATGGPPAGGAATAGPQGEPTPEATITAPAIAPAEPAAPGHGAEADVITALLQVLARSVPPGAIRGACTFSNGQKSYCASLSGPQCDGLDGAFNAGEDCPATGPQPAPTTPPATSNPPASDSHDAQPPPDSPPPAAAAPDAQPAPNSPPPPDAQPAPDAPAPPSAPTGASEPTPPDATPPPASPPPGR